ncbi:hypothetical protein, partial [Klebsiella sp. 28]|uniref:hypothetical protein n=1 Tax=Klebsiella sp. 28 TaxID=2822431 RepID=UPI001BA7E904
PDMQNALRLNDEIRQFTDSMVMGLADWETLPYDSFSPHQDIISSRLATLYQLPTMQRVLHVRRHQHHRAAVAFGHLRHQGGAGCAGQLAKLALIAGFDRQ